MTKAFLNFGNLPKNYSRRFPGNARFGSAAYKTDGELAAEKKAFIDEMLGKVNEELKTRKFVSSDDIKAAFETRMNETFKDVPLDAIRELAKVGEDGKPAVMAILSKQGADLLELQNRGLGYKDKLSIRTQLTEWRNANKAALESIASGNKADLTALELRVASPMTPANTYNSSAYLPVPEFQPGAYDIVRPQPTFWDYLSKGSTSSAAYVFVNKKNPLGAAGFIGPGVAKPGVSFEIDTQISNAKKIAANEKVAIELLQDIEGFASWVEQELTYQVMQKASLTLMSGTLSATVPAGIQTLSTTFTETGIETTSPNNWDCLIACVAQLRHGNLVGAVTAFVNPIDYANMKLTKAVSQGQPFIAPDPGVKIVEDNNIPVGYVQVAILQYYKVLIYKGFTITYGWENDDFTKNLITVIGEMRIHQMFSDNFTGAFIYDTFANIKTAITAAP